ncbi:MAG TPA: nickel pincer cofactor biosynthesis protein LarC [Bacteroidales bacterium]|nr:nickel pincer cofactor biosynthesis protein LarC [Bacteroidales bacterium]
MRILYYDCFSGVSGDMNLGAMIDLGVDADLLRSELAKLNLEGWELRIETDQRHRIVGTKATVIHDAKRLHHRNLEDIKNIIDSSGVGAGVKDLANRIFRLIAEAEAEVHKVPVDKIHFHEVGAVDSIIDIVGAAVCFDMMSVEKVFVSKVELGSGFVKCDHGVLPVPTPATAEILKDIPVSKGGVDFEATTPTGAAIIATLGDEFGGILNFKIVKTGYGIGQKESPRRPNLLRVHLAETLTGSLIGSEALLMESNIDDMNPELFEGLMDRLLEAGASDVYLTPVIMKKSRPGTKISIVCYSDKKEQITKILFRESTTLGIRSTPIEKLMLEREFKHVDTPFGKISVKFSYYEGKVVAAKPEFDRCNEIARKEGIPLREVYRIIERCIDEEKSK